MTTFVLVHGAWSGGWKWRLVAPLLRLSGHEVFAPTLTGLGERAHLARPDIDLGLQVQDVVALLEMEDLRDIVLVGHSYGGMVVTGAAERAPQRIRRLVYLDAFVPEDGKCALDYVVAERAARFREEGERTGFVSPPPASLWGVVSPEHVAFARQRERPHPYRCFTERLRRANSSAAALPKTFIYCSSPATGTFDQFAAKYRKDPAWRFHELKTGHDSMILVPQELAALLLRQI
ncbi:MAG TPA: alpha/beta fold hydrolase [Burkholderiales bacterium]|nr:alpha/beta fold hydrolase [Burkholderiales bacterium]